MEQRKASSNVTRSNSVRMISTLTIFSECSSEELVSLTLTLNADIINNRLREGLTTIITEQVIISNSIKGNLRTLLWFCCSKWDLFYWYSYSALWWTLLLASQMYPTNSLTSRTVTTQCRCFHTDSSSPTSWANAQHGTSEQTRTGSSG